MRTTRWVGAIVSTMVLLSMRSHRRHGPRASAEPSRSPCPDSADVTMRKMDAADFLASTGLWVNKWEQPNVDGEMRTAGALGVGYATVVRLGPECPGDRVHQTLYPYVEGGPQVFTPEGESFCGAEVPEGYYPARADAFDMLVAAGLPATAPEEALTPAPTPAAASTAGSSGSSGGWWIALVAIALALGGYLVVRARRPRTAAEPHPTA